MMSRVIYILVLASLLIICFSGSAFGLAAKCYVCDEQVGTATTTTTTTMSPKPTINCAIENGTLTQCRDHFGKVPGISPTSFMCTETTKNEKDDKGKPYKTKTRTCSLSAIKGEKPGCEQLSNGDKVCFCDKDGCNHVNAKYNAGNNLKLQGPLLPVLLISFAVFC